MAMPCLREFAPALFASEDPVVSFYGFPYPTRMAMIMLSGGGLFIWSPVALTAALKSEIDALGPVRCAGAGKTPRLADRTRAHRA
ncbi:MAG: hypothetical protein WCF20_10370 [Methylovirgula sp.]